MYIMFSCINIYADLAEYRYACIRIYEYIMLAA